MKKIYDISLKSLACIAVLIGLDTNGTRKKIPLSRINSQISFPLSNAQHSRDMSMQDEFSNFIDANKLELKEKIIKDINNRERMAASTLLKLGEKLGIKQAILKNGKTIEVLDISYPTMKACAQKIITEATIPATGNVNNFGQTLNLKDLADIMTLISDVSCSVDESGAEDRRYTKISDETIQQLLKFCFGKNRLFYCEKAIEEKTKKMIVATLKNYTGFQRIASMLIASTLNLSEDYYFVKNHSFWRIVEDMPDSGTCYTITSSVHIPLDTSDDNIVTFIHEIGHAYDAMLMENLENGDNSLETYSIINSSAANFVDLFFPSLTASVFENSVEKLEIILNDILDIDAIRSDIKSHIDHGYDFKIFASRVIFNAFRSLVYAGFGSRVFDLDDLKTQDDYRFDSEKTLNTKNIARALYIVSAYTRKGSVDDAYEYVVNGMEFNFQHGETLQTIWDGPWEMLTMIGIVPYVINGHTFVINDRQNEFIANKRMLNLQNDVENEDDLNVFRMHDVGRDASSYLRNILTNIMMQGTINEQYFSEIMHIHQPKNMMHTSSEIIGEELSFKDSDTAIEVLKRYGTEESNNVVHNQRNFIKYGLAYIDGNADLLLAVLRKDQSKIEQLLSVTQDISTQGISIMNQRLCELIGKTPNKTTMLHVAVANEDTDVTRTLLKNMKVGINDIVDDERRTPLHIAVMTGNWEITKLLLQYGAIDKLDQNSVRPSDIMHWPREFSLPRLSLNPIYKCIIFADQKTMDNGLETIGLKIPKNKIAIIQEKLRSEHAVTEAELDTILITTKSEIYEINQRINEWNGIGHIYYLMVYTDNISQTNKHILYNIIKNSGCTFSEEELSMRYIDFSKTAEDIISAFTALGIKLPEEKIQALQNKLRSYDIVTDNELNTIKISEQSITLEGQICCNMWNSIGHLLFLRKFTNNLSKINRLQLDKKLQLLPSNNRLSNLVGEFFNDIPDQKTSEVLDQKTSKVLDQETSKVIDKYIKDYAGVEIPNGVIRNIQKKLRSDENVTEADLQSILVNSSETIGTGYQYVWNYLGSIYYLLAFTENISKSNLEILEKIVEQKVKAPTYVEYLRKVGNIFSRQPAYCMLCTCDITPKFYSSLDCPTLIEENIINTVLAIYELLTRKAEPSVLGKIFRERLVSDVDIYSTLFRMHDSIKHWTDNDRSNVWMSHDGTGNNPAVCDVSYVLYKGDEFLGTLEKLSRKMPTYTNALKEEYIHKYLENAAVTIENLKTVLQSEWRYKKIINLLQLLPVILQSKKQAFQLQKSIINAITGWINTLK